MKYVRLMAAAGAALSLMLSGAAGAAEKKIIAWVPNGASDFWKLAEAGMAKAQKELPDFDLQWKYPERADAAIQQRLIEDLVAAGVSAVAVSPVNPKTQTEAFNNIASQVPLFTFDSDAADSKRAFYIGSSNTELGKNAGEIAVRAMPNGGKCMGFVGNTGADNAVERIAGFKEVAGPKNIELIDVRTDDHDQTRARANVDDTLVAHPEVNCMVGFYSYNPPKIFESLQANGKLGQITVIAFDEDPITLGAVKDGSFAGTVVQQPFEWAYQGSKLFAASLNGDKSGVPANGVLIIPGKIVGRDNVDEFKADLEAKLNAQ
ncbi:MAG TPA: substrate-binding domain-containing protein [Aestuariivirga sp.]